MAKLNLQRLLRARFKVAYLFSESKPAQGEGGAERPTQLQTPTCDHTSIRHRIAFGVTQRERTLNSARKNQASNGAWSMAYSVAALQ